MKVNIHEMRLNPQPFEMIRSGKKTVELRLNDEKRQKIKLGDTIIFTSTEGGERLTVSVLGLHRFSNFGELYKALPLLECGYTEEDVGEAQPSDMERYYSAEDIARYGVLGIEIRLTEADSE